MDLSAHRKLDSYVESEPMYHGERPMQMLVGLIIGAPICALIIWAMFS